MNTDTGDTPQHRRYVEQGGCQYIEGKTWCNGRQGDGHPDHWALYLHADQTTTRVFLRRATFVGPLPDATDA
jgi:hypothetical protein